MWAQGMDFHLYSLALIDCLSDNHAFSPFSGTLPRLAPMPCHSPCNGFSPGFSSLCTHLLGLQTLVFISGGGRTGWCCAMLHHPAQPSRGSAGSCSIQPHPVGPWKSLSKVLPCLGLCSRTTGLSSGSTQQFLTLLFKTHCVSQRKNPIYRGWERLHHHELL